MLKNEHYYNNKIKNRRTNYYDIYNITTTNTIIQNSTNLTINIVCINEIKISIGKIPLERKRSFYGEGWPHFSLLIVFMFVFKHSLNSNAQSFVLANING